MNQRLNLLLVVSVLSLQLLNVGCAQSQKTETPVAPAASTESTPAAAVSAPAATLPLSKNLADLRNSITALEAETFGDAKAKQLGLSGELKICQTQLASKAYGGSGELLWDEPTERLSEEWLKSGDLGIETYQAVFLVAQYRRDYFKRELETCQQTKSQKTASGDAVAVNVVEGDSDNDERVHKFVCGFVTPNASLRDFLIQSFSRGTLKLEDFDLGQKFLVSALKDKSGKERPNGLMFMGWKLSFDNGPLTLREVLLERRDASLKAWAFSGTEESLKDTKGCLKKGPFVWNG